MASNDWKKMTVYDARGMNRHNGRTERINGNHANKQIDKSKSHLNVFIGCSDYSEACQEMLTRVKAVDEFYPPKKKRKPDQRIICAMIEVPCPQEIVDRGYDTVRQFFYDVYGIYKKFFGADNVHGGFVHFDEVHEYTDKDGSKRMSLPHMHCLVSAYSEWTEKNKKTGELTERKGINGKHFETKVRMKQLNKMVDDYCMEVFHVPFLTGETPQRKSVEQLKAEEELHQITEKKKQEQALIKERQNQNQQLLTEKDSLLSEIEKLKEEKAQAKQEADSIISNAEERAEQILAQARKQRDEFLQSEKIAEEYRVKAIDFFTHNPEPQLPDKPKSNFINKAHAESEYQKHLTTYRQEHEFWEVGRNLVEENTTERERLRTEREKLAKERMALEQKRKQLQEEQEKTARLHEQLLQQMQENKKRESELERMKADLVAHAEQMAQEMYEARIALDERIIQNAQHKMDLIESLKRNCPKFQNQNEGGLSLDGIQRGVTYNE